MKPTRSGKVSLIVGLALGTLGVACHGFAAYTFLRAPHKEHTSEAAANSGSCQQVLASLKFETSRVGAEIRAARPTIENPERLLSDASIAIAACNLPLARFCIGPACQAPAMPAGISFALAQRP